MLKITLLKTLFNEMDKDVIKEIREYDNGDASRYHELDMEVPGYPEVKTLTAEVNYLAYNATQYYVHVNGNLAEEAEVRDPMVNAAIWHFFKTYRPEYFKENLDESEESILNALDIAKIPDYRPKHAFPGIVMLDDIKNGTAAMPEANKPTFPGLRMLMGGSSEEPDDSKPAYISKDQEFTEFKGEEDFNAKMDELKAKFSIDSLLTVPPKK